MDDKFKRKLSEAEKLAKKGQGQSQGYKYASGDDDDSESYSLPSSFSNTTMTPGGATNFSMPPIQNMPGRLVWFCCNILVNAFCFDSSVVCVRLFAVFACM